jgi:hypothetical protein
LPPGKYGDFAAYSKASDSFLLEDPIATKYPAFLGRTISRLQAGI